MHYRLKKTEYFLGHVSLCGSYADGAISASGNMDQRSKNQVLKSSKLSGSPVPPHTHTHKNRKIIVVCFY